MKSSGLFGNHKSDEIEKIAQDFMVASLEAMKQDSDEPSEPQPAEKPARHGQASHHIEQPRILPAPASPQPPSLPETTILVRNPGGPAVGTLSEEEKSLLLGMDSPDGEVDIHPDQDDSAADDELQKDKTPSLAEQIRLNATEPEENPPTSTPPEIPTPQEDTPPQNLANRAACPELLDTLLKEIVRRDIAHHRYPLSWEN